MEERIWNRIVKYTELQGTSGQEHAVRKAFREDLTPLVDEAVSYTHLRAHETDSYLVCRLLLEKKKKYLKKKNNKYGIVNLFY